MHSARVSTGIPGLDTHLEGGLPRNRCVMVSGDTGTGKTTFGVQFLMEGIRNGEPGVLVSVDQKPQHVVEDAVGFGWNLADASERKQLALLNASPYFTASRGKPGLDAPSVARDLAQQVRRMQAKRLVIDSLTSLVPLGATLEEAQGFLRALFFSLDDNLECTVVMTAHTSYAGEHAPAARLAEVFASGLFELKRSAQGRSVTIHKMHGTSIEQLEHPLQIVRERGIVL
ncbi:MAG TPA: ATPase domain-containing protein [Vicinamibacterales bacterium]|nr:ATPase domain-containing protein [Vicinamibacterales bacterium]